VLIAAGFLAYNNYLDASAVVLISAIASYIGHGAFFLIALHRREVFLKYIRRVIKVNLSRLESLMEKYGVASIFISQWIYGFRLLSAAVLGLSRMGKKKYFTYLLVSCLIWATICTYGGYFFGATLKNIVGNLKGYELPIALGVLAVGFIIWLLRDVMIRRDVSNTKH
jgi:membrane protein DedA with SNARE-associated domain